MRFVAAPPAPPVVLACSGCGREREVSARTAKLIGCGDRTGLCEACRTVTRDERLRRWWLHVAGVDERAIAEAGGAEAWVRAHGLPEVLWEMAAA